MVSFSLFFGVLILILSDVYVWSRFFDEKVCFSNIRVLFIVLCLSLLAMLNSVYMNGYLRILLSVIMIIFGNYVIFKKKFNETIISTIFGYLLLTFSDVLSVFLLILTFGRDATFVKSNFFATFVGNILVSIIFILICMIPFVKKIYVKLVNLTNSFSIKNIIFSCLLLVISINFLMAFIYYDMNSICSFIINSLLVIIYSFIVYRSLYEKNNSMVVKAQNESLMTNLHQYEDMVDRQRVDNHENKNQLLIIKNMIKKKDKDVIKYIDTVVKDQKEDDEALYTRVMSIPSGGLQGIIYQKMLVMKDECIKFNLNVSRDVRNFELDKLSMNDNYRLCKIVGVFLDNAIEESRRIEDKFVMISLYIDDDELVIEVSNKFEGKIDVDKLDQSGYTTKGESHGYGLSLVKKILTQTNKFENVRSISKNVFKQVIRIKNT